MYKKEDEQIVKKITHCNPYSVVKITFFIPIDVGQVLDYKNTLFVYYIISFVYFLVKQKLVSNIYYLK